MKKNYITWSIVAAIVVVIAGAWFFFGRTPASEGTVKLGVVAGQTGDYAAVGEAFNKGFQLALKEWNASNTLQFQATVEDNGFNAQKGVTAYNKLKSVDAVDAYVILDSFTIDAILESVHQENKPVALGFEQSTPATNDNVFQLVPAARPIQKGLGENIKKLGYKSPVVVESNTTSVYANFAAGFVDGYGSNVIRETVSDDVQELRTLATKIVAQKPDIVVFYMNPRNGALLTQEIIRQSQGTPPKFAYDQSIQNGIDEYKQVFGQTLAHLNGSLVALSRNDFTPEFKRAYQEEYGSEPQFGSDAGYNAFMILADSYDSNSASWISNMAKARFTGADGQVSFDSVGLRVPNVYFVQVKDDDFVEVK